MMIVRFLYFCEPTNVKNPSLLIYDAIGIKFIAPNKKFELREADLIDLVLIPCELSGAQHFSL